MPMVKNGSTKTAPVAATTPVAETSKVAAPASIDSGIKAATSRLQKKTETTATAPAAKAYAGRDFDKEARGKSLCLLYGHAIGSALIAGTKFEDLEGAFQNMKFFVERAMKEIFAD